MELQEIKKNERIFTKGSPVGEIGILISGSVRMTDGKAGIILKNGALIGIPEYPGDSYIFDYIAAEDSKVAIYQYTDLTDVKKILQVNAKIAPIICSATVSMTVESYAAYESVSDAAEKEYQKIQSDYADYPSMVKTLGESPKDFPGVENIEEVPSPENMQPWMIEMLKAMKENEEALQKMMLFE